MAMRGGWRMEGPNVSTRLVHPDSDSPEVVDADLSSPGDRGMGPRNLTRRDDKALATQAALGDRASYAELVRRYGPRLYRYAVRMLNSRHEDAEDAVQDALIDAWLHLPEFRGDSAVSTWLFRLTANRVLAARRRRRPVLVDEDLLDARADDGHSGPEDRMQHAELREVLDVALSELPWRQRASWILREMEGLSYDDIAVVLHTTPTVVRGQLHRARRSLAARMDQWR